MVTGIHHISAIAGAPQPNIDFYTDTLGMRMIKQTVNFDDPYTYHLYYGDSIGHPGGILTFFPWANIKRGHNGTGLVTVTSFIIPEDSLEFWIERLTERTVAFDTPAERFGERYIRLRDDDGSFVELIGSKPPDNYTHWQDSPIIEKNSIHGFHSATLTVPDYESTASVLTDILNFNFINEEGNRYRFKQSGEDSGQIIDVENNPEMGYGRMGKGIVHHIAFRVPDGDIQREIREQIVEAGLNPTPVINRQYFESVYFREPNGILFEIATDVPGFMIDESEDRLGTELQLPQWYESRRDELTERLPEIRIPWVTLSE